MISWLPLVLRASTSMARSHASLAAENAVFRHQLSVLQREQPKPLLRPADLEAGPIGSGHSWSPPKCRILIPIGHTVNPARFSVLRRPRQGPPILLAFLHWVKHGSHRWPPSSPLGSAVSITYPQVRGSEVTFILFKGRIHFGRIPWLVQDQGLTLPEFLKNNMAYSIPSGDFLVLCLHLCDGDADANTTQVMESSERFQLAHDCQFGVTERDFDHAWRWLAVELDLIDLGELVLLPDRVARLPLRDWILPILSFKAVYFNDEGEYWVRDNESSKFFERNRPVRAFFAEPARLTRHEIAAFLLANGIDERFALSWSEAGGWYCDMIPERWR